MYKKCFVFNLYSFSFVKYGCILSCLTRQIHQKITQKSSRISRKPQFRESQHEYFSTISRENFTRFSRERNSTQHTVPTSVALEKTLYTTATFHPILNWKTPGNTLQKMYVTRFLKTLRGESVIFYLRGLSAPFASQYQHLSLTNHWYSNKNCYTQGFIFTIC